MRLASSLPCALAASATVFALAGCGGAGTGQGSSAAAGSAAPPSTHVAAHRSVPALVPPPDAPHASVSVPVLTYHRVAPASAVGQLDLKVEPSSFLDELAALHRSGYHTIHQAQLFDALYKRGSLPHKAVIISVDDGYVDDVTRILPSLKRYHMVATFFVITGRMTEPGFLTAAQIRELDNAGMDVGDHTTHHVDLRLLTPSQLKLETAGSRHTLERVLGHRVYYFAYPFGTYNSNVLRGVRAAGFTMAYTTGSGITESTSAPLTMPRIHVGRALTPRGLLAQLGGA